MTRSIAYLALLACFATAFAGTARYDVRPIPLSDKPGLVTLDYFAWDPALHLLWVPAGNLDAVRVIDASGNVREVPGFPSAEFTLRTRKGRLGASSATIAPGAVFVGSRADSTITSIDPNTLERKGALRIAPAADGWAGAPDGIAYVADTKEIWITRGAPPIGIASSDKALTVLDASDPWHLRETAKVPIGGSAEGYAVDERRGMFFTNLEETGETLMIDVRKRSIAGRWKNGCDGARGLAIDVQHALLFAACSSRVVAMDLDHAGRVVGSVETGDGLDNIDYSPSQRLLYAAASKVGTLTIARVDDSGEMTRVATVPTAQGARGVVAGDGATAYVADPYGGRILVVTPD